MKWSRVGQEPSIRQLRLFGALWVPLLLLLWVRAASDPLQVGLGYSLAAASFLFALLRPTAISPVYQLIEKLFEPLRILVSGVLLALLYFTVVVPLGLLLRGFGYDPMGRKANAGAVSYWTARGEEPTPVHYMRPY